MTDPQPSNFERARNALGNQDPFEILQTTPIVVQRLIEQTPIDVLIARPFDDKWTPLEIVGHLIDAEMVFGLRLRLMLTEDEPQLPNWNHDAAVKRQRFNDRNPGTLAMQLMLIRRANLPLWESLTPEDMKRSGIHTREGRITLADNLRVVAGHDLLHLDQMRRYIAAAAATQPV